MPTVGTLGPSFPLLLFPKGLYDPRLRPEPSRVGAPVVLGLGEPIPGNVPNPNPLGEEVSSVGRLAKRILIEALVPKSKIEEVLAEPPIYP